MSGSLLDLASFDVSKVVFGDVIRTQRGNFSVKLFYEKPKRPIRFQLPMVMIPWKAELEQSEEDRKYVCHTIDVSIDRDSNERAASYADLYIEKMNQLSQRLRTEVVNQSKDWIGKQIRESDLETMFSDIVKPPRDPKYNPVTKVRMEVRESSGPDVRLAPPACCSVSLAAAERCGWSR